MRFQLAEIDSGRDDLHVDFIRKAAILDIVIHFFGRYDERVAFFEAVIEKTRHNAVTNGVNVLQKSDIILVIGMKRVNPRGVTAQCE